MTRIPYTEPDSAEFTYYGGGTARMLFSSNGMRLVYESSGDRDCAWDYTIFYLIKYMANSQAEFTVEIPAIDTDRLEQLGKKVNLRSHFDRYGPLRQPAADALSREHQIMLEDAAPIIDVAFYTYQKELYEENPILAVRDYNREWSVRQRRIDEIDAKRRENNARRHRY